jgi:hypothetical protein
MKKNAGKTIPEFPTPEETKDLALPDLPDPLIDAFKKDVDRTLLRENLKLTVEQRARKMQAFIKSVDAIPGLAATAKK